MNLPKILTALLGRQAVNGLALTFTLAWGWMAYSAELPKEPSKSGTNQTAAEAVRELVAFADKHATVEPLLPGPQDPNITRVVVAMLEKTHYLRRGLDKELTDRWLHRYLEMLDPMHMQFYQSDIRQFERQAEGLAEATMKRGESQLARDIFARFLQRLDQRVESVARWLEENDFSFIGDDRYLPNRKDAPWPSDEASAKALWRQHLRYEYLQEKLNKQKPDQIIKTLAGRYKRLLRSWSELDSDEVLQVYLTALAQSYDPHSDYMGKAQLENFAISMNLSLFGIGALLRSEDGYCKIESLTPGNPAARSKKIKPGDRIVAVAQKGEDPVDVIDMKLNKVVEMIRGPKGTEVTLTIIPADAADPSERKLVTLVRDEVKLEDSQAKARLFETQDAQGHPVRLGVIDLPSFYANFDIGNRKDKGPGRSTTTDVAALIKKLEAEKVNGIVLDLRRNGGGSLEEAIRLTGLFIKDGPVVQVRGADGDVHVEHDPDGSVLYDGPLAVLTSRFSASASEILAAALQDYGRAVIVGDTNTHGKGTVQTIYELNKVRTPIPANVNPGALKDTIRMFYRINGGSTQLRGVSPDVILPSVANYLEVGEQSLENALPWNPIEPAKYEPLNRVKPYLETLRQRTDLRQKTDKDYAYVREDVDLYRKALADKTVSLNEEVRRKEKQENEDRVKARKAEQKARPDTKEVFYEISLEDAAKQGLPEPGVRKKPEEEELVSKAKDPEIDGDEEDEPDSKTPPNDVGLNETKRILMDLAALSAAAPQSAPPVAAKQP